MTLGPVQVLVVGFSYGQHVGEILAELRLLCEQEPVRLVDVLLVSKDEDGRLTRMDLDRLADGEWSTFGELVEALIGFGASGEEGLTVGADAGAADGADRADAGQAWAISDAIPAGTCAAVALIEHRWAIPLRGAIKRSGGFALEDTWLRPADLIAAGGMARRRVS